MTEKEKHWRDQLKLRHCWTSNGSFSPCIKPRQHYFTLLHSNQKLLQDDKTGPGILQTTWLSQCGTLFSSAVHVTYLPVGKGPGLPQPNPTFHWVSRRSSRAEGSDRGEPPKEAPNPPDLWLSSTPAVFRGSDPFILNSGHPALFLFPGRGLSIYLQDLPLSQGKLPKWYFSKLLNKRPFEERQTSTI